jgi:predicted phosphodiesterase
MILMLGDVHGDIDHLPYLIDEIKPAAVIFLGDIEAPLPFQHFVAEISALTEVWWIPGNHDTDTTENYVHLYESELADRNLHGRVVNIAGVRVAGLGGVFRRQVWYPPEAPSFLSFEDMVGEKFRHKKALTAAELARLKYQKPSPLVAEVVREGQLRKHRSTIFYSDWYGLHGQQADILVTHEAPSCHPYGFAEIDLLGKHLGVQRAFHGHQHDNLDYRSFDERFGFKVFGVGFRGVTDMLGNGILPGHYDAASQNPAGERKCP